VKLRPFGHRGAFLEARNVNGAVGPVALEMSSSLVVVMLRTVSANTVEVTLRGDPEHCNGGGLMIVVSAWADESPRLGDRFYLHLNQEVGR
jgi:hypothetical protein